MNILIRADSSSAIGLGHIMRDLVLAKQFYEDDVQFACRDLSGNIMHKVVDSGYQVHILNSDSLDELVELIKTYDIDMVVFDHYEIDYAFEKEIKNQTGVKIFVLDDIYEKHYSDILLNHNIYAEETKYKNLVPKWCEIRCGSRFTLIRDEFKIERAKPKPVRKDKSIKNIFLAMGGTDSKNVTLEILQVLGKFNNILVRVITTSANANIFELEKFAKGKNWIELFVDTNKMAKILNSCDFAIVTPSVILHEVIFLEKPFLAIKTAENQDEMVDYLRNKKYLILNKSDKQKLSKMVEKVL